MDRELSASTIQQQRLRNILWGVGIIGAIVVGLYFFRSSLTTSLNPSKFKTAIAEIGDVENTITATGEVLPEFEQVITSSIQAEIKQLLIPVGTRVQPNQPILELNKEFALLLSLIHI